MKLIKKDINIMLNSIMSIMEFNKDSRNNYKNMVLKQIRDKYNTERLTKKYDIMELIINKVVNNNDNYNNGAYIRFTGGSTVYSKVKSYDEALTKAQKDDFVGDRNIIEIHPYFSTFEYEHIHDIITELGHSY